MRGLIVLSVALLTSCSGGNSLRCADDAGCEGIAVCNEVGLCQEVECTLPEQCGLGETCRENECVVGCDGDQDCLAGETCGDSGQCEPYGCRSTTLDCNYGERCDTFTGQCVTDTAPHCQANCTVDFFGDTCSAQYPGAVCACFDGNGSQCFESYCLVSCDANAADPCPRGYQCVQAFQNSTVTYCIADCEFVNGL